MNSKNELINILKAELTLLTKDILQNLHQKDLIRLYKATRQLQEKMAAIMLLEEHLDEAELLKLIQKETDQQVVEKNNFESFEPETKQQTKPERKIERQTVKEDNPYKNINKMSFVPKGTKTNETSMDGSKPASLKKVNIGLNDRIAFIKNLFNNDADKYTYFIKRLNAFESYDEALSFIKNEIKPQFDNWEAKEEYELRLLQLLELKFT